MVFCENRIKVARIRAIEGAKSDNDVLRSGDAKL